MKDKAEVLIVTESVETSVSFIKSGPEYNPTQLIHVVDHDSLHKHYGQLTSHRQRKLFSLSE
jgi:hypothetical protein